MEKFSKLDYLDGLRGADLSAGEFRVLVTVVGYANSYDGRNAHPGNPTLARDCGMTERSVERHLKSLMSKGWLSQRVRGGRNGAGDSWASTYDLRTPRVSTRQTCRDDTESQPDNSSVSTRQNVSLNPTICVAQPDTTVDPPGFIPGFIPGPIYPDVCHVSNADARDESDRFYTFAEMSEEWLKSYEEECA